MQGNKSAFECYKRISWCRLGRSGSGPALELGSGPAFGRWHSPVTSKYQVRMGIGIIVPQLGEPRSIFGFYLHYRELRTARSQNAMKRLIMALGLHSTCFDEYFLDPLIRAARVIDERLIVHSCYRAMHRTP